MPRNRRAWATKELSVHKELHLIMGGEAGQGLDTVSGLLGKAVVRSGRHLLAAQHVMSRVRGGHNNFRLRIGARPVQGPPDSFHLLAAMSRESVDLHKDKLKEPGIILADAAWELPVLPGMVAIPFAELASRPVFRNVALLGVLGAMLGLEASLFEEQLEEQFRAKGDEIVSSNLRVLAAAMKWAAENAPSLPLPESAGASGMLSMDGNQAVVLGALAAGVRFCGYYPMSPATSIAEGLVQAAVEMGVVVEQAEDEIAAANMALGAAYAGARSIVPTSGGGFALMTEAVSLAGVSETPVVFVVVQRPGPATGLATRTEQADLDLVLHAGHGEFPRAILAPATLEDCFYLTHKAFDLAEKSQGPVFVLSDQYLASAVRSVAPFELDGLPSVAGPDLKDSDPENYRRYNWAKPVSPRRIPGHGQSLVLVDSHEHNEAGHIIEDGGTRVRMQDKRLAKMGVLLSEVLPPEFSGDEEPDLLLVGWGSTCEVLREVTARLRASGVKAACLCFTQVWPLIPETFMPHLEAARTVVTVEGNSTAQFAGLLRKTTGFHIHDTVLRYDGRTLTAGFVMERLQPILEAL
ncbi:2-oxoacid:acceptor oxidoreductase subunit alpha [Desulfomicrobium sp. ZS1]|uniref:2-oxoacid:acceptor oxidoreductase subunit alpha n=1 Tax=Desulfomicrobium sp. ZS1 TaxID=2952228 RepID=UPI0035310350